VLIRTVISIVNGIAAGLWLWLMGSILLCSGAWGFFWSTTSQTSGRSLRRTLPVLLAFVQFGFGWGLLTAAGLLAIDQVLGNYFDPRLTDKALNASSLVLLLSVIFWGWIWSVAGALLAVPLTSRSSCSAPTCRRCSRSRYCSAPTSMATPGKIVRCSRKVACCSEPSASQ
jgi:AI-2 transport protein TqsA